METMKDYCDLYLKYTALLLAFFEKFRNNNLRNHGLCPSHYLSAPAWKLDAMLFMTKVVLELIPDPDIYILRKMCYRLSFYISNRYSKASNKYLKSYDPKQEPKRLY